VRFVFTRREALDLADGINSFLFALSDRLVRLGHEVFLITPSRTSEERVSELFAASKYSALFSLSADPTPSHLEMVALWRHTGVALVKDLAPDVTILNGGLPFRIGNRSCIVVHDLERRWGYGNRARRAYKGFAYRRADRIVVTCSELRTAVAEEIHLPPRQIDVIPTCIDVESYSGEPLAWRDPAIVHLGMPRYKNPVATLRMFAALNCRAELYITGRPTPEVLEFVAAMPRAKRASVHLVGILAATDLRRLLGRARVLSVPSEYHVPVASPSALEGLASGTPVLGSDGISRDLLEPGVTGARMLPRYPESAATAVERMLDDDELWSLLSANALTRSMRFGSSIVARRYLELGESLGAQNELSA